MLQRSTTVGIPFSSRTETSASPIPSSVKVSNVLNAGFSRKDSAAALADFNSAGVYARSACWILVPSWLNTPFGISLGFCVMKNTPTP